MCIAGKAAVDEGTREAMERIDTMKRSSLLAFGGFDSLLAVDGASAVAR